MPMPVESGIVDTNVLIYALDTAAPQHAAARALLEAAREDAATLFVTSQILCEFCSVTTNPRRVARPRDAAEAMTVLSEILAFLHVLPVPAGTIDKLLDLLRRRPVTGIDVFDLHIVATMHLTTEVSRRWNLLLRSSRALARPRTQRFYSVRLAS